MTNDTPSTEQHDHEPMPEGEEHAPPGVRIMSVVRWGLVALMATAAIVAWLQFAPASRTPARAPIEAAGTPTEGAADAPPAAATYICPMHPQVVQDHPGDCPICGMDLVPLVKRSGGGTHDHGVEGVVPVELTQDRVQLMGMRTALVRTERIAPSVRTVGYVAADERRVSRIHARAAGWVEELLARETGQHVRQGEVLARVYSPELLAAQRELVTVTTQATGGEASQLARDLADDVRRKLALLGMSAGDIAELERTGRPSRTINLRAPVTGHVTTKGAFDGLYFQPGTALFEVADLSTVWVLADVYESELARVRVGQKAVVELGAYLGRTFKGTVGFIYPAVDASTRTMRVRVAVPNGELKLLPGMYGQVTISTGGEDGLVVPVEAMIDTGEQQYVFLAKPGGRFEPRRVRFGPRTGGGDVQVLEGLDEGETVVTTANFLLDSESRLRAALERPAPSRTHDHATPGDGAAHLEN